MLLFTAMIEIHAGGTALNALVTFINIDVKDQRLACNYCSYIAIQNLTFVEWRYYGH